MPSQNETVNVWDGRPLGSGPCALVPVDSDVASFSAGFAACGPGTTDVFVPPGAIGDFLKIHAGQGLIMPSAAETAIRLQRYLDQTNNGPAIQAIWECADANRLYDPAIMALLLELAGDDRAAMNPTDASAPTAVGPHRHLACAAGFHADVTKLGERIAEVARRAGAPAEAVTRFGPLALGTQMRGAIALAAAHHIGFRLGSRARTDLIRRCEELRDRGLSKLAGHQGFAECCKGGTKPRLNGNGFPDVRRDKMQLWIQSEMNNARDRHGAPVPYRSQPGRLDADIELDRFDDVYAPVVSLQVWREVQAASRLRHELAKLSGDLIKPVYGVLRSVQPWQPDLHILKRVAANPALSPADGGAFVVVRLPDLTLCALAAVCEARNGTSALADAARAGRSPARVVAEILEASRPRGEEVSGESEQHLSRAATMLEVVATGLDASGVSAVLHSRGLDRLRIECQHVMDHLVQSLPELGAVLIDRRLERFAERLRLSVEQVVTVLRPYVVAGEVSTRVLSDVILGTENGRSDWTAIEALAFLMADRHLAARILLTQTGEQPTFYRDYVEDENIVTLTGRIMGRPYWAEARYGEVRLLADDALKEALFALTAEGFQLAGVAGNELVLQVGEDEDDERDRAISECVRKGVSRAIPSIPITVEVQKQVLW